MFERPPSSSPPQTRRALAGTTLSHAVGLLLAVALSRSATPADQATTAAAGPTPRLVWLASPGRAGGGGSGGGNGDPTPARKAEAPGRDRVTLQVAPPPDTAATATPPPDRAPLLELTAVPTAAGLATLAGIIEAQPTAAADSRGSGDGASGGPGAGPGDGPGRGAGVGPGRDRESGGEYAVGNGVSAPRLLRDAKPRYTPEAMRARISGTVGLSCVVAADGSVRDCRLTRSLDARYGLDLEAIRAAQHWQFEPGRRDNAPVAVRVAIEMAFSVR